MQKRPIISGVGELLWDMLPTGKQLGGAPCNFAFHAMQAGCECYVVSAIGNDDLGNELMATVSQLGLSDRYIQKNSFPTSTVTIRLNDQGHPDYTIHEEVAWDHIHWNSLIQSLAGELDAVCFGSLAQRSPDSQQTVVKLISSTNPQCLRIFDINLRQHYYTKETITSSIELSDVLKLNEEEMPVVSGFMGLTGDIRDQLHQLIRSMNLKYVIYTMGGQGSIIASPHEYSFIEAPLVTVADTVGAGDAFTAVFAAGILKNIPVPIVHRKATDVAAWVCTQKGATPKLPNSIF